MTFGSPLNPMKLLMNKNKINNKYYKYWLNCGLLVPQILILLCSLSGIVYGIINNDNYVIINSLLVSMFLLITIIITIIIYKVEQVPPYTGKNPYSLPMTEPALTYVGDNSSNPSATQDYVHFNMQNIIHLEPHV